jgi:CRP/FNR family transcriptional regulator
VVHFWSLPRTSVAGLETTIGTVFADAHSRRHEAGSLLSDPTAAPRRAFLVAAGALKVTKLLSNGREILITILEPGAIWSDCALIKGYWRETYIETISPAQTLSVDNQQFEERVYRDPEIVAALMNRIGEQISDALTLLDDFRGRDVATRLASLIVRLSKQYGVEQGETVVINLPFTHQDLANMIGTARETVSRSMSRFRADGLVRDGGMATLEVLDLRKLEALFG